MDEVSWHYDGREVLLLDPEGKPIDVPIMDQEALRDGVRVFAPTLFGSVLATVRRLEAGELYWESERVVGDLTFGADGRNCWVTSYAINKRGIEKLKIT